MTSRTDYGKPGDPSGCYFPQEWRASGCAKQTKPIAERVLTLPLKTEYFDAIRDGNKAEEYRLTTPYWRKRLEGRDYDRIMLTRGYPARDDSARRLERLWKGCRVITLVHPHFGPGAVEVYAINVAAPTRSVGISRSEMNPSPNHPQQQGEKP